MLPRKKRTNMDEKKLRQMKYPKVKKKKKIKEIVITVFYLLLAQIDIIVMLWTAKGFDFVKCVKVYKND